MSNTNYSSFSRTLTSPAGSLRPVTPSDDADLPEGVCKSLYATGSGDLALIAESDTVPVTLTVSAGLVVPVRARRVLATGTTATVVALY